MLLDLTMLCRDGRGMLATLKQDPTLHTVPVNILTTSANSRDVAECYRLGANSYLTKPMVYRALEEKVGRLTRYWLEASELPHQTQPFLQ